MSIESLDQVSRLLQARVPVPAIYTSLNTRLILQTGVNLKKIAPEQAQDKSLVRKVLAALGKMGVDLETET